MFGLLKNITKNSETPRINETLSFSVERFFGNKMPLPGSNLAISHWSIEAYALNASKLPKFVFKRFMGIFSVNPMILSCSVRSNRREMSKIRKRNLILIFQKLNYPERHEKTFFQLKLIRNRFVVVNNFCIATTWKSMVGVVVCACLFVNMRERYFSLKGITFVMFVFFLNLEEI